MYIINSMSFQDSVTLLKATTSEERLIGRVKWFNNKAGYGFITVTDGSQSGADIFVHHTVIGVSSQQYKYLVQGEYVEFSISSTQNSTHDFQASNVCGIKGGKLMCETRNEFKVARNNYKTSTDQTSPTPTPIQSESGTVKMPRQQRSPKVQTTDVDKKEWTLIKSSKPAQTPASGRGGAGRGSASGRGQGRPARTTQESK
jgi:CspA family cold shock protein